ncbi:MAG: double zinc ribbon domain-containing protein [Sulfuricaulis sp.]
MWPGNCLLCAARMPAGGDICAACEQSLPRLSAACPRCAAPGAVTEAGNTTCGECQKLEPAYLFTRAAFRYAPPVDKLIQNLKYHGRLDLSRVLGACLAEHLQSLNDPPPDVIVPVPLHTTRLRERGYNQSLEIARFVAKRMRRPLNARDAWRVRPTAPQTKLTRDQRRKNVRGAFRTGAAFAGQRIAVVDDVMTSGYTAEAFARSLLQNGARDVRLWVVARA